MKRKTVYFVDVFDEGRHHFTTKQKAIAFAERHGNPDWFVHRLTMLGVGTRKGRNRRTWKKAHSIYYYSDCGTGGKLVVGNRKGRPWAETLRFLEKISKPPTTAPQADQAHP